MMNPFVRGVKLAHGNSYDPFGRNSFTIDEDGGDYYPAHEFKGSDEERDLLAEDEDEAWLAYREEQD